MEEQVQKFYSWHLVIAAVATSLIIAPYFSYEAVNPPKLLVLVSFGFASGAIILFRIFRFPIGKFRTSTLITGIFVFCLIFTWILSPGNYVSKFFGINGRHTGVLTYISLTFIYLLSVFIASLEFLNLIIRGIIFTGIVSMTYAVVQIFDLDPFPWQNNETWVQSFFANPNFFAAFLSFTAMPAVAYILSRKEWSKHFLLAIIYLILVLFVLRKTLTYQGFFTLALTSGVLVTILIIKYWKSIYLKSFLILLFLSSLILILLDLLQKAPWSSVFYKASLSTRGDYWRAALKIFQDHPIFGIGLDQFRNYYERYRDVSAAQNREGALLADAIHNIYLDLLVGGGLLLFFAYLLLLFFTLISVFRYLKRNQKVSFQYLSVLGIFLAYLIQSFISINHLGLAIWGWLSAGALIGTEISTRGNLSSDGDLTYKNGNRNKRSLNRSKIGITEIFVTFIGGLVGMFLSLPVIQVNHEIIYAYKNSSPQLLYQAAIKWPKDTWRMSSTAETLRNMGYVKEAFSLTQLAIEFDPESVIPWKVLNDFTDLPPELRVTIEKEIHKRDPLLDFTPNS